MVGRATAPRGDDAFRATLRDTAGVVLGSVSALSSVVPGLPTVAAALQRGASADGDLRASSLALTSGDAATSGTTDYQAMVDRSGDQSMELIALQQRISDENRVYSTLSNVLKARHETAKNAIGNIR